MLEGGHAEEEAVVLKTLVVDLHLKKSCLVLFPTKVLVRN